MKVRSQVPSSSGTRRTPASHLLHLQVWKDRAESRTREEVEKR